MKFLIVFALFGAVAYTLPVENVGQDQEVAEPLSSAINYENDNFDYGNDVFLREKRQFVGYANPASYGGYGAQRGYGNYGREIGGYGGGFGGSHHGHHGGRHFGK